MYASVVELVSYYQCHTLAEYNPGLDIALLYPVPDPRRVRFCKLGVDKYENVMCTMLDNQHGCLQSPLS